MSARLSLCVFLGLCVLLSPPAHAEFYPYSEYKTVIGFSTTYEVEGTESLIEIARKFGLGYNEITAANPDIDPLIPGSGKINST